MSKFNSNENTVARRSFIKSLALGIFALPIVSGLRSLSALAAPPAGKAECKTTDPVAAAIGYAVVTKDKTKECVNCMFYGKVDAGYGTCQLMPNCVVPAKATCNSFQKKA